MGCWLFWVQSCVLISLNFLFSFDGHPPSSYVLVLSFIYAVAFFLLSFLFFYYELFSIWMKWMIYFLFELWLYFMLMPSMLFWKMWYLSFFFLFYKKEMSLLYHSGAVTTVHAISIFRAIISFLLSHLILFDYFWTTKCSLVLTNPAKCRSVIQAVEKKDRWEPSNSSLNTFWKEIKCKSPIWSFSLSACTSIIYVVLYLFSLMINIFFQVHFLKRNILQFSGFVWADNRVT